VSCEGSDGSELITKCSQDPVLCDSLQSVALAKGKLHVKAEATQDFMATQCKSLKVEGF
jgi:hypothetical protein